MNVAEGLAFSVNWATVFLRVDMMEKPTPSLRSTASPWAAAARWPWPATSASLPEKAKFGQPEVGSGHIPSASAGTQRMARIIGTGPAMELIYTADTIDAQRPGDRHGQPRGPC